MFGFAVAQTPTISPCTRFVWVQPQPKKKKKPAAPTAEALARFEEEQKQKSLGQHLERMKAQQFKARHTGGISIADEERASGGNVSAMDWFVFCRPSLRLHISLRICLM